jgi:hypothetical protein
MEIDMLDRRTFLKACGAAFVAGLDPLSQAALAKSDALFVSACKKADGKFAAALFTEDGTIVHLEDCPSRAHDVSLCPVTGRLAAFARRPGTFALIFDPKGRRPPVSITSVAGRHFYGHGVFSRDGRLLYATENDFEAARGVVGIYDASDRFQRIGEFESGGVGPHEMLLAPDGRTLVIANGGIETHPDYGRAKLNLDTMQPSIAFIDCATGAMIEQYRCEKNLHRLSLRHFAFDRNGDVWFGAQYEGPETDLPPLLGRLRRGSDPALIALPSAPQKAMRNYVGSVAASRDGEQIAFSSPHGNLIVVLDLGGNLVDSIRLTDGCGVAPLDRSFIATSGEGVIANVNTQTRVATADVRWDDHITPIPAG